MLKGIKWPVTGRAAPLFKESVMYVDNVGDDFMPWPVEKRRGIQIVMEANEWDTNGINLVQVAVNEDYGVHVEPFEGKIIIVLQSDEVFAAMDNEQLADLGISLIDQAVE